MNDQKSTSGGQFIADPNGTPEKSQNHSQSKQNKEGPTESTPINKNRNSDDTSISAISAYFKKCSMNSDSDSNTSNIDYDTGTFLNHIAIFTLEIIQINKPL